MGGWWSAADLLSPFEGKDAWQTYYEGVACRET